MLPNVTLEGRVAADPELRFTPSGKAVAKVRVVSSSRKKDESGEWVDDKVCWLNATVWDKQAEHVAESIVKGDLVVITGRLVTDEWEDKTTNEKRSATSILADFITPSLKFGPRPHGQAAERTSAPAAATEDPWATPLPLGDDQPPF